VLELCRVLNFLEPCPDVCLSGYTCSFASPPTSHWPCPECLLGHSPNNFTDSTKRSDSVQTVNRPRVSRTPHVSLQYLIFLIYHTELDQNLCSTCYRYHLAVIPCLPRCIYHTPCLYARPSTSDWSCDGCHSDQVNLRRGWESSPSLVINCPFS
jgi:hypothetical protein